MIKKVNYLVKKIREEHKMCKTMNELEKVIADYRSMKILLSQTEAEVKELEKEIFGYMDFNQKISETGKDFSIKVSSCERTTLDRKKLEEQFGSMAAYQKVSQYRRLYVR